MLTYIVATVVDLLTTMILAGLVFAYAREKWDRPGLLVMTVALIAGAVAALVMAVMKQTTDKINTGMWNLGIFIAALCVLIIFLVFCIGKLNRTRVGQWVAQIALAAFLALRLFYKLPDVYLYPFNFNLSDNSVLSTDFLYRIIGYLLGIVLVVLLAVALYKLTKGLATGKIVLPMGAIAILLAIYQMMTGVQTMLARRMIPQNHQLFEVVKVFANNLTAFSVICCLIACVPIVMVIINSLKFKEPYKNQAELRKIKAKWRNRRRWAIVAAVCLVLATAVLTAVQSYNNRPIELSPTEECEVTDGNCIVYFDQVNDGSLHRFGYETENGVMVRFIIIQKPGSSAYGIGLDACDICGEAGYFERDGQVVCKRCDVVMNINTIGFKGGCNPIVIDYVIEDGKIIVPVSELVAHEGDFK